MDAERAGRVRGGRDDAATADAPDDDREAGEVGAVAELDGRIEGVQSTWRMRRGTGGCSETIPKIGLDEAASLRIAAGSSRAVAWRLPCGAERPRP